MRGPFKRAVSPAIAIAAAGAALGGAATLGSSCGGETVPLPATSGATHPPQGRGTGGGDDATGSATGSVVVPSFAPRGCGFSIAARPEYQDFTLGQPVSSANPNLRRVRLGLGGNVAVGAPGRADPSTSIAFAWQTDHGTLASDVTWGTDPDPVKWPADNRARGVTWFTPPGLINGSGPVRMHEAYVCGLKPATTYYYRVGGGPAGGEAWSDVSRFATTPSDPEATVKIGVTGDSRGEQSDAWRLLQQRLKLAGVGLQLFSGDVVTLAADQGEWEQWLDAASRDADNKPLTLSEVLMLAAHGNHEAHNTLYFGNMVFPQDQARYPRYAELFYSVDVGPAHIVVIDDTWLAYPTDDPDYKATITSWLHEDLTLAVKNRARVPWIITVQHRSEFSSASHGRDADVLRVREHLVPIWDKYHVDLALRGHDHNYERSKPLTGPASSPTAHALPAEGTIYVVCAGAGAPAYAPGVSAFTEVSHGFVATGAIGLYGVLTVSKAELTLVAHELRPDGTDPVFDTLTITR